MRISLGTVSANSPLVQTIGSAISRQEGATITNGQSWVNPSGIAYSPVAKPNFPSPTFP